MNRLSIAAALALPLAAGWAADAPSSAPTREQASPALWTYQDFLDGKLPPAYTVRTGHPRLLITPENRPEIVEKIKAGPALWQQAIDKAENRTAARADWQQMLACACIYQVGLVPGFKYASTREQYGRKAVELLMKHDYVRDAVMGGNPKYYANPCAYDWVYDLLSSEQRQAAVAHMAEQARKYAADPGYGPWKLPAVNAVDNQALILGLAFFGDGIDDDAAKQIVEGAWREVVWNPKYSDQCCSDRARTVLYLIRKLEGGGNDEGINYFSSHGTFPVHAAAWKTAAGVDLFSHMGYFRNLPYWLSFVTQPTSEGTLGRLVCLHAYYWAWTLWYDNPEVGACMAAASGYLREADPHGAALAHWWVRQTFGGAAKVPYLPMFLYGLLIGDPRIEPAAPREMKLPLTHVMRGYNYVLMRSDYWDNADATILLFANARYAYRAMASNDFALSHNGAPLFLCRAHTVFHGYIPPGAVADNTLVFYKGTQLKRPGLLLPPDVYHPSDDAQVAQIDSVPGQYDYVVGTTGNITGPQRADRDLRRASRTLVYLRPQPGDAAGRVVLLDHTETASAEVVPHVVFNTVFQPQVGADWNTPAQGEPVHAGQTSFARSPCAVVTVNHEFQRPGKAGVRGHGRAFLKTLYPADIRTLTIGGPEHFMDDITGQGSQNHEPCQGFFKWDQAKQIDEGGYWRFDIVPQAPSTTHAILNVIEPADSSVDRPTGPLELLEGPNVLGAQAGRNIVLFSRDGQQLRSGSAKAAAGGALRVLIANLKPHTQYQLHAGANVRKVTTTAAGTALANDVTLAAGETVAIGP